MAEADVPDGATSAAGRGTPDGEASGGDGAISPDAERFIDDLVLGRRPRAFAADDEDVAVVRAAIALAAARPGADSPRPEFVDDLRNRIAAEHESAPPTLLLRSRAALRTQRRRLLQTAAVAASALTVGFLVGHGRRQGAPAAVSGADSTIVPSIGVWRSVVASSELTEGAVLPFDLGAVVGVLQRTSGRLRAVSSVCTHQACRLALNSARNTLACPCHGATFAVDGAPLHNFRSSEPLPALPRLPVREFRGDVQVYCPAPADG